MRPAVREKKSLRSLPVLQQQTLGSYRGLNQSEIEKGGPQTFVYDAFLLFANQKRDRAHVDEFSTRNMKALFMIEERTDH